MLSRVTSFWASRPLACNIRRAITAAVPSNEPTAIALPFRSRRRGDRRVDDQVMHRPVMGDIDDLDRQPAQRRRQTAAGMASDIDLAGHQAAQANHAAHHQNLQVQSFLSKESALLAVVKMSVTQRRPRNADVKPLRRRCALADAKCQRKEQPNSAIANLPHTASRIWFVLEINHFAASAA